MSEQTLEERVRYHLHAKLASKDLAHDLDVIVQRLAVYERRLGNLERWATRTHQRLHALERHDGSLESAVRRAMK